MVALVSPYWRWLVTDLCGEGITLLDHLASERTVTPKLNEPLELTGTVPSDNSEVNRLHTDGLPFLAEGVREIYGFRREYNTVGEIYEWNIRASTLVLQANDAARSDDARTRFTAWDAWQYLFYVPVYVFMGESSGLVPREGYTYYGMTATEIILDMLFYGWSFSSFTFNCSGDFDVGPNDMFLDFGQVDGGAWFTGVLEATRTPSGFKVAQGATIGQTIQDLCAAGYCDVWMEPIYDPTNRPGILNQLNVYEQSLADTTSGMGDFNYSARFAWDRPGRSLVGADDLFDGTQRANRVAFARGQAGSAVTEQQDLTSMGVYGDYWALQNYPVQSADKGIVEAIAAEQLLLRKNYKQTLTVNPAPERSPEPWVDYFLGDRVPVFISDNMRQALPPTGSDELVWQRVYGIPVDIDDNGTETVRELLVGPVGPPPPATGPGAPGSKELGTTSSTAVGASGGAGVRTMRRGGTISRVSPFRRSIL